MKLYCFNPNDYGDYFHVVAENKIKAYDFLLEYLTNKANIKSSYGTYWKICLDIWKNVNPLDATTFPDKYTLNEFPEGYVTRVECS